MSRAKTALLLRQGTVRAQATEQYVHVIGSVLEALEPVSDSIDVLDVTDSESLRVESAERWILLSGPGAAEDEVADSAAWVRLAEQQSDRVHRMPRVHTTMATEPVVEIRLARTAVSAMALGVGVGASLLGASVALGAFFSGVGVDLFTRANALLAGLAGAGLLLTVRLAWARTLGAWGPHYRYIGRQAEEAETVRRQWPRILGPRRIEP